MSARGESRLDFEHGAVAWRQRSLGRDTAARHEERRDESRLGSGHKDAAFEPADPIQPPELAANVLQCVDPVPQPRRILEPALLGQRGKAAPEAGESVCRPLEIVRP